MAEDGETRQCDGGQTVSRVAKRRGAYLLNPVEANEVFVRLPLRVVAGLREAGFAFYDWPGAEPGTIRLVTAFSTDPTQSFFPHGAATIRTEGRVTFHDA